MIPDSRSLGRKQPEKRAARQGCIVYYSCICVFLCKSVPDLSLIKLDQSWPGSIAAVVEDQVSQDGQTLLI